MPSSLITQKDLTNHPFSLLRESAIEKIRKSGFPECDETSILSTPAHAALYRYILSRFAEDHPAEVALMMAEITPDPALL